MSWKSLHNFFFGSVNGSSTSDITLFISITMFRGTDNVPRRVFPTFGLNMGNIRECSVKSCQSHLTLLWIWIMLWMQMELLSYNSINIRMILLGIHVTLLILCRKFCGPMNVEGIVPHFLPECSSTPHIHIDLQKLLQPTMKIWHLYGTTICGT
jgi:hypothetical protein